MAERVSIGVLMEAVEVQRRKSQDYQHPNSTVVQADYYPRGVWSIYDVMHAKMLRIRSLLESGAEAKNEPLEDSFKDLINYASFGVAWCRGGVPGQDPKRGLFNDGKVSLSGLSKKETAVDPTEYFKPTLSHFIPPETPDKDLPWVDLVRKPWVDLVGNPVRTVKTFNDTSMELPCDVEPPSESTVGTLKGSTEWKEVPGAGMVFTPPESMLPNPLLGDLGDLSPAPAPGRVAVEEARLRGEVKRPDEEILF